MVMTKKVTRLFILSLLVLFSLVFIVGCDAGLEIIGMEIVKYPDRLIYVANVDNTLDVSGGEIRLLLKDKSVESIAPMSGDEAEIRHNIDFDTPGIYVVTLYRHDDAQAQFPIQVISKEQMREMLEVGINE